MLALFPSKNLEATASVAIETPSSLEVIENAALNGIELKFADRPADHIIARIKSAGGWRWHRVKKIWYAKNTPDRMAFAMSLKLV